MLCGDKRSMVQAQYCSELPALYGIARLCDLFVPRRSMNEGTTSVENIKKIGLCVKRRKMGFAIFSCS